MMTLRRRSAFVLFALIAAVAFTAGGPRRAAAAKEGAPYRTADDRPIDVKHLRLDLDVDLDAQKVEAEATIDLAPRWAMRTIELDAVGLEVDAVENGEGRAVEFTNTGERLLIEPGSEVPAGERRRFVIRYSVSDPEEGLYFFKPTDARPTVRKSVWSQGEPERARHWIPCRDQPNERQTTEIIATVPEGFKALSNGSLISKETHDDGRVTFHWKQEKAHPAYLITLAVGRYEVTRTSWNGRPVTYYLPPELAEHAETSFGPTREMLTFFSERFGIEYPWAKYAQVVVEQFLAGAMENTSATTMNEFMVHDERALIGSSPDWIIAHELAHHWWGNLVTCEEWSHLWLNEGLATYSECLWLEHKRGTPAMRYRLWKKARGARSGSAKRRPVVDRGYGDPWSMFDGRAYNKGAWIVHMLRCRLGEASFFDALEAYGRRFGNRAAETADLRQTLERETGRNLERFFRDWTRRPGHPKLTVTSRYDVKEEQLRVEVQQTQEAEAFAFPLRIELRFEDHEPRTIDRRVDRKSLSLSVPVPARPTAVRVDPGYTLLCELTEKKPNDWWRAQLEAPTVPEQLRAVQHFADSKKKRHRRLLADRLTDGEAFHGVRIEAAKALGRATGKVGREALRNALHADHPKVRRAAAGALGHFYGDEKVIDALTAKLSAGDESYFVHAAALRSLGRIHPNPPLKRIRRALQRDSHNQVIREAALDTAAWSTDPAATELLRKWTVRREIEDVRDEAIRALATHLRHAPVGASTRTAAVRSLAELLDEAEPKAVRRAAVQALGDVATPADRVTRPLESVAERDPEQDIREKARKAIERIRSDREPTAELSRLRKQLRELENEQEQLSERLGKGNNSKDE